MDQHIKHLLLSGIFCVGSAGAQTPVSTLQNVCSATLSTAESRVVTATAFLIPQGDVVYNAGNNTYSVNNHAMTTWGTEPVCSTSQYDGMTVANSGRTAIMIGPDLFMTAPHNFATFVPSQYRIVFRPTPSLGCSDFTWTNIPAAHVYTPQSGAAAYMGSGSYDYVAFRVTTPVTGRKPLKIRRSGTPHLDDAVFMAGFPMRGGMKVEQSGEIIDLPAMFGTPGYWHYDLHPFDGSSGSAIYNLDDEVVDVVVRELINGFVEEFPEGAGTCYDFVHLDVLQTLGFRTNHPVVDISASVPRAEVLVSPIDAVVHVGDIGGPLSNFATNYQLRPGEASSQYAVDAPTGTGYGTTGAPYMTSNIAPGDRTLTVDPTTLTLSAYSAGVSKCGVWNYTVNVRDRVNEQNNYLRHRFEIGMQEITVSPADGWNVADLGLPFGQTKTYTLTNERPTETWVRASVSELWIGSSWLKVNGLDSVDVGLAPKGTPGDQATVTLSVASGASSRTPFVAYPAALNIEFLDEDCALQDAFQRTASFTLGQQAFTQYNEDDVILNAPPASTFGTPLTYEFDINEGGGFCVGDVDLAVGTYVDGSAPADLAAQAMQITLRSPDGSSVLLWDRNTVPNAAYLGEETIEAFSTTLETELLLLDDTASPPLAGSLSTFNGENIDGTWELELRRTSPPSNTIYPSHARLTFKRGTCTP